MSKVLRLFFLTALAACGTGPVQSSDGAPSAPAEEPAAHKQMLPAHPLPGERGGGKADQYDDFRLENPSTYGITAAPQTPMRAVGQFDDHQRLLLAWTGNFPNTVAGIVAAANSKIDIYVMHEGQVSKQQFLNAMAQYGVSTAGIDYLNVNLNSIWVRDYGPLSVRTPAGEVAFVDPRYYHPRVYDDAIPSVIGKAWGINVFRQPLGWEGGTYITDGQGNCYYSQGVLWYGGTTQEKIEQYQRDYLGCETNIVLKPLIEEGTTHSDMFAKLASKNSMVLGEYKTSQDAGNKAVLDDNEAIIEAATLLDGSKVTVTRIPMPSNSNRTVWRTYANSLFVNGVNLVPVYEDDTTYEAQALAVWQQVMPTWQHVPIDSTDLITWSGAIHCITMTVPDGSLTKAEADPDYLCNGSFDCYPTSTGAGSCSLAYEGCCGAETVQLCGANGPKTLSCGGANCGWNPATNAYACGGSGQGPANAPMSCGTACVPSCAGKACGADGCGGSCGTCPAGETCNGGQCQADDDPCGGITYEGCCDGGTLKYCDNGVQTQSCNGGVCGWNNGSGWYDCGFSGADPSGAFPKACPSECTPECGGKVCGGDGCGGSCGACPSGQSCTAQGQCACQPSCAGKQCGGNGCGGSCGTCPAGSTCNAQGQCAPQCTPSCSGKQCGPDGCGGACGVCAGGQACSADGKCQAAQGCGDVTFEGFCTGTVLTWCDDGQLATYDCTSLGNFECKAIPGSSPPNHDCLEKAGCTASCEGKQCGSDGCGGTCGSCADGKVCQSGQCVSPSDPCEGLTFQGCCDGNVLNWCQNNQKQTLNCGGSGCGWNGTGKYYDCNHSGDGPAQFPKACGGSACVPNCAGKVCGGDGCGGSCGVCTGGATCNNGQCVDPCGGVPYEGQCAGSTLSYCEDQQVSNADCTQFGGCCGWDSEQQYYNCLEGPACNACVDACQAGQAGCSQAGTHAWTCDTSGPCNNRVFTPCQGGACNSSTGQCPTCAPSCAGKQCGSDGCGGSCGSCGAGASCNGNGQCVTACVPDCDGKSCGSDGCGGSCGTCAQGLGCVSGKCVPTTCTPKCEGKVCGDDNCGGSCGACEAGLICSKQGQCIDPPMCEPDCDGKACGPDGCGGSCGVCSKDSSCKDGQCVLNPDAACGGVPKAGVCEGDLLRFCDETGAISEINCAAQGLVCGSASAGFDCVDPNACTPQCAGKSCGSDGCGGSCGSCSKGDLCADGTCVSDTCLPKCQDKQCGDDGCGGSCGTCDEGTCSATGQCEAGTTDGIDGTDGDPQSTDGTDGDERPDNAGGCACDVSGPRAPAQSTGGGALVLLLAGLWLGLRRRTSVRSR